MIVDADGYRFDFTDAINVFKFDETDPTSPTFHGAPMKAVDVIAELSDFYLFIEIKEYPASYDPDAIIGEKTCSEVDCPNRTKHLEWLKNNLKYKFRDSFIYRYAEDKTKKPVHYLCLLNFDDALNSVIRKTLRRELPIDKVPARWVKTLAQSCQVLNLDAWNRNFPKWPAQKVRAA